MGRLDLFHYQCANESFMLPMDVEPPVPSKFHPYN